MSSELVSIVIPTYKRSDKIGRAVASAVRQTYRNVEIIVVDDSPIDFVERYAVRQAVLNTCKTVKYLSTLFP